MKATKLVIGASLLIALAAAAAPTASASGIVDCTDPDILTTVPVPNDEEYSVEDCLGDKNAECEAILLPHERAMCLVFGP